MIFKEPMQCLSYAAPTFILSKMFSGAACVRIVMQPDSLWIYIYGFLYVDYTSADAYISLKQSIILSSIMEASCFTAQGTLPYRNGDGAEQFPAVYLVTITHGILNIIFFSLHRLVS